MGQSWAVPETDGRIVGIAMVFSNTISVCSAWRWDEVRLGSVDLWRDPGCGEWVPMVGSTYLSDDESEGRFSKFAPNQYSKYKRGHKEVKFLSFLHPCDPLWLSFSVCRLPLNGSGKPRSCCTFESCCFTNTRRAGRFADLTKWWAFTVTLGMSGLLCAHNVLSKHTHTYT